MFCFSTNWLMMSSVSRLAQQYMYPQAFLQPSLLLQSQLGPSAALASPYLDYSSAYSHYTHPGLEQYPYAASPSPSTGFLSYSFSPGTSAPTLTASPTPPTAMHPSLAALSAMSGPPQAFLHYPLHQPDRMQWATLSCGTDDSKQRDCWPVTSSSSSGWDWITRERVWRNQKGFKKTLSFLSFYIYIIIIIVVIVDENVPMLLSWAYDLNVFHTWQTSGTGIRRSYCCCWRQADCWRADM